MLKKAAIIVGAVLAGLIALSPLAFAGSADLPCKKADREYNEPVNALHIGEGNLNQCNIVNLPTP